MRKNLTKKGISFALIIFFILSIMIISTPEVLAADVILSTSTSAGLQQAIDDAGTTPTVIYITEDFAFNGSTVRIPADADITIKSNPNPNQVFTLGQNSYDIVTRRHFFVAGKLTLENIVLDGGIGTLSADSCGGGVRVDSTGTLIMNSGATIQNSYVGNNMDDYSHSTSAVGGGVHLTPSGSRLEMNEGAIIRGNKAVGNGRGGGVYVGHNSQMIMTGGEITNNEAAGSETYGGGVMVYQGSFVMNGNALISGNKCDRYGGGVFVGETSAVDSVGGGSFKMNGGTISGNSALGGGGIFARGTAVEFVLSGGEISNNEATSNNGGGIYVYYSTLTVNNSVISENTSAAQGGGIFAYECKLIVNDSNIAGNITATQGGGISAFSSEVQIKGGIIGGTEADDANTAAAGGGIYSGGSNGTISISDTAMIDKNRASGDGGGIYMTENNILNIDSSCSIINNSAQNDGGGIYTEDTTYQDVTTDYGNLSIGASTVFRGNTAAAAYVPPENAANLYPNIGFAGASTSSHPINNYDINYKNDKPLTCKLTYDANGGTGGYIGYDNEPGSSTTVLSADVAGISNGDYQFAGWNTKADGTGINYSPGSEITVWNDVTLYAQWVVTAKPETQKEPTNPSTGDNNRMPLLIGILLISLVMGIALMLGYRKKSVR